MSNHATLAPSVLCVYGSPRIRGNTDLLLDAFAAGVEAAGGTAQRVYLRNLTISPCREIYACEREGRCALNDDMQPLYDALRTTDAIALASPIMFYNVSAQTKAFLDRCQAFWCIKYRRGEPVTDHPLALRKGVFLSVGGSKGAKLFDGARLTVKYFLETVDAVLWNTLTYRTIDARGDIAQHPSALIEARALGGELVEAVRRELAEVSRDRP
ncbi:MAG: flavodoxin family protein [Deferrisomatales bacterium]|nr:flavodoxin family protein [Deferrisomatales bacterium]